MLKLERYVCVSRITIKLNEEMSKTLFNQKKSTACCPLLFSLIHYAVLQPRLKRNQHNEKHKSQVQDILFIKSKQGKKISGGEAISSLSGSHDGLQQSGERWRCGSRPF